MLHYRRHHRWVYSGVLDQAFGWTGDNITNVTRGFEPLSKPGELAQFGKLSGAPGRSFRGGGADDDKWRRPGRTNLQSALNQ